jgi:hypothetical protein
MHSKMHTTDAQKHMTVFVQSVRYCGSTLMKFEANRQSYNSQIPNVIKHRSQVLVLSHATRHMEKLEMGISATFYCKVAKNYKQFRDMERRPSVSPNFGKEHWKL